LKGQKRNPAPLNQGDRVNWVEVSGGMRRLGNKILGNRANPRKRNGSNMNPQGIAKGLFTKQKKTAQVASLREEHREG